MRAIPDQVHDRFIRDPECEEISGLSRTTRWRLERKGLFPKRRRISPNGVGWLLSEINEWVVEQMRQNEKIRPLKEAYQSLTESFAKIVDLVDIIILRGKPAGTCFFCPRDSRP